MSDIELRRIQERTLTVYAVVVVLMLIGIAVMVAYAIRLGPLTSSGTQTSFGYALSLMSLMGAVLFHVADRTYRAWPLGRRLRPAAPGRLTAEAHVWFLIVVALVLMAAAIACVVRSWWA